jgi:hypothetical protein
MMTDCVRRAKRGTLYVVGGIYTPEEGLGKEEGEDEYADEDGRGVTFVCLVSKIDAR